MFCCYCVLLCLVWSCLYNLGYVAALVFTMQVSWFGFGCGLVVKCGCYCGGCLFELIVVVLLWCYWLSTCLV